MKCVLYTLGKDRTGVVAGIATVLTESGANIRDISQTVLSDDMFSMTMLVTLDLEVAGFNEVQERLAAEGERLGMQVSLQRQDVFEYMYKI